MKVEYQFCVEGWINKEQVVSVLLKSGYIISLLDKENNIYEVSVYGKTDELKEYPPLKF